MTKITLFLFLLLGSTLSYGATLNDFKGSFKNIDSSTRGLTKIQISDFNSSDQAELKIRVKGKCHPNDCDWGQKVATAYTTDVEANIVQKTLAITAIYKTRVATNIITMSKIGSRPLYKVEVYTKFNNGDRRSHYKKTYTFQRETTHKKLPDLIVKRISPMGRSGKMRVTVKNIGLSMAGTSYVRVTDPTKLQSTGAPYNVVGQISPLAPNQEKTIVLSLPYNFVRPGTSLEGEADYKRMVTESNENNNIKIWNN